VRTVLIAVQCLALLQLSACSETKPLAFSKGRLEKICTSGERPSGEYVTVPGKWTVIQHAPEDAQAYRVAARHTPSDEEIWLRSSAGEVILCEPGFKTKGGRCNHFITVFPSGPVPKEPVEMLGSICLT
jgi:hypothetical protein